MEKQRKIVDVLVIGTSPIMLFEAILQTKKGNQVLVIEANEQLGGAWEAAMKFGYKLDNGPHLFYTLKKNLKSIFHFISYETGMEFKSYSFQPQGEKSLLGLNTPEFNFEHFKQIKSLKTLIRFIILFLFSSITFFLYKWFGLNTFRYKYPIGGSDNMIQTFKDYLVSKNVRILTSHRVSKLTINDDLCIAEIDNEKVFGRSVVSTSRITLTSIKVAEKKHTFQYSIIKLTQLIIKYENVPKQLFSYFKFCENLDFYIAADITGTATPLPINGVRLIGITLTKNNENIEKYTKAFVDKELKKRKLINPDGKLLEMHFEQYNSIQRDKKQVKDFNKLHKNLEFIYCDNLMRAFLERYKNYEQI
jgi:hypothetical protein